MNKNKSNFSQPNMNIRKQRNTNTSRLFIILLVVQFYLIPLIAWAAGRDLDRYRDYLYLYTITSYTIIVLAIIIFHDKGLNVLQDHYSLWTIVGACLLAASAGNTLAVYRIFLSLLALRLSVHILMNRKSLKTPAFRSILIGLSWSLITTIMIALMLAYMNPAGEALPPKLSAHIWTSSLFQVSFITVIEEACFRGLLFGLLMMNGYEENTALFAQAMLFWGIHYLKITNTSVFFVAVPLLTISTTWITKKYKMPYLSVMIHTFVNVLGPILIIVFQNS